MSSAAEYERGFVQKLGEFRLAGRETLTLPPSILDAVCALPRAGFVEQFTLGGNKHDIIGRDHPDYLPLVYSPRVLTYAAPDGAESWATNSEPGFVLHLVNLLGIEPGGNVLEIGSGTGWIAAIMARLAAPGSVLGLELRPDLVEVARRIAARHGLKNLSFETGSVLSKRRYQHRFNRILFSASISSLPAAVFDALEIHGVIGFPLRHRGLAEGFFMLRKLDENSAASFFSLGSKFVPVFGQREDDTGLQGLPDGLRTLIAEGKAGNDTDLQFSAPEKKKPWLLTKRFTGYLSRKYPGSLRVFDLSPDAPAQNLGWSYSGPEDFGFGLVAEDGRKGERALALWREHRISLFGDAARAASLRDEILKSAGEWRDAGYPGEEQYGLTITRRSAPGSPRPFIETRGRFDYCWSVPQP